MGFFIISINTAIMDLHGHLQVLEEKIKGKTSPLVIQTVVLLFILPVNTNLLLGVIHQNRQLSHLYALGWVDFCFILVKIRFYAREFCINRELLSLETVKGGGGK
jgi:hypothetical protein